MARLPIPGSDDGQWGTILNDFLSQAHKNDGTLKDNSVSSSQLKANAVTSTSLGATNGNDGQVLIKNSSEPSGLSWQALETETVDDATTSTKGTIQLAGDLDGSASAPTVPGLANKEPLITTGTTAQYYRGDKSWQTLDKTAVGLASVDNTSDAEKPVSNATKSALDTKADTTAVGSKILLIDNAASLPPGTPAGVIVVVKS